MAIAAGSAQAAGIGEGGQDDESDDERQVAGQPVPEMPMPPMTTCRPTSCSAI